MQNQFCTIEPWGKTPIVYWLIDGVGATNVRAVFLLFLLLRKPAVAGGIIPLQHSDTMLVETAHVRDGVNRAEPKQRADE
jgi:hypothetical protein